MYFRCPSAKIVSKARELLPEPETPVRTTRRSRGISTSRFLRLCSRAPRTRIARGSDGGLAAGMRWIEGSGRLSGGFAAAGRLDFARRVVKPLEVGTHSCRNAGPIGSACRIDRTPKGRSGREDRRVQSRIPCPIAPPRWSQRTARSRGRPRLRRRRRRVPIGSLGRGSSRRRDASGSAWARFAAGEQRGADTDGMPPIGLMSPMGIMASSVSRPIELIAGLHQTKRARCSHRAPPALRLHDL